MKKHNFENLEHYKEYIIKARLRNTGLKGIYNHIRARFTIIGDIPILRYIIAVSPIVFREAEIKRLLKVINKNEKTADYPQIEQDLLILNLKGNRTMIISSQALLHAIARNDYLLSSNGNIALDKIKALFTIRSFQKAIKTRTRNIALYEVSIFTSKKEWKIIGYELHIIRIRYQKETDIEFKDGHIAHYKECIREILASDEDFGQFAWQYTASDNGYQRALNHYNELAKLEQ